MALLTRRHRAQPGRAGAVLIGVAIALCALTTPASAAGPNAVVNLAGCTANTLPANDDGSTAAVPIGFSASFFGAGPYTSLYVNNNGNVTFDAALGDYTPFDFSISGNVMIAPFLADVDTRSGAVVTYGQTTFDGQPAFCVDWSNVGYFSNHTDKLNTFQLLLVKRGTDGSFDAIFNYDQIKWETGDASGGTSGFGGTPAAWGFANGDGDASHFFVGPGSFTTQALVDGGPSALIASSRGTTQLGRYIFSVTAAGLTGPKLSGTVKDLSNNSVAFAPVQICPTGGGTCTTRTTNSSGVYQAFGLNGSYNLTAFPPPSSSNAPGHAGPVTISTVSVVQNITLGANPLAPPSDTTITSIATNPDGIPVSYWTDPLTLTTHGCTGGTASYTMTVDGVQLRNGPLAEGPAGTYTAAIAPLAPNHGQGVVHVAIVCPNAAENKTFDFGVYIDPSGVVRNSLGAPISGVTVQLLRAGTAGGTLAPVPDGSAVMSPGNRSNPSLTSSDGRFGWDVVAGFYKVRASKNGCVSSADHSSPYADSALLTIPPPVTTLDLRLYCGEVAAPAGGTPPPPPPPPPPTADRTPPLLTALKVSPSAFRVSSAATAVAAAVSRKKKTAGGSKITFGLSERSTVLFTIARKTTGRRAGATCKKQSRSNRKGKRCTRYVVAGTLKRSNLSPGANSVAFSGRIGSRKLPRGSYRLLAGPTDVAGNSGIQRTATFRIIR